MSNLRADTISNKAGTGPTALTKQWASKMWCNFDGSGTIAIRDSRNVSSLVDDGVGLYGLNFTSAMANANYAGAGGCAAVTWYGGFSPRGGSQGSTITRWAAHNDAGASGSFIDSPLCLVSIDGELA